MPTPKRQITDSETRKIRSMLRRAKKRTGDVDYEADNAARFARDLMDRYGVEIDIDDEEEESQPITVDILEMSKNDLRRLVACAVGISRGCKIDDTGAVRAWGTAEALTDAKAQIRVINERVDHEAQVSRYVPDSPSDAMFRISYTQTVVRRLHEGPKTEAPPPPINIAPEPTPEVRIPDFNAMTKAMVAPPRNVHDQDRLREAYDRGRIEGTAVKLTVYKPSKRKGTNSDARRRTPVGQGLPDRR